MGREALADGHLELVAALEKAGTHPALIHAVKVTGLFIDEDAYSSVPDDRLAEWLTGIEEGEELHGEGGRCECEADLSDETLGL
jgi:hypothetical protein